MDYAGNRSIISSPPRVGDKSSSIEDDCCLQIDGGRYLAIDSGGNYYLSDRPTPIKGQKIPNEMSGVPVFQVDRGGDYFELVTFGVLAGDLRHIWTAGDEILFNELFDLDSEEEILARPVFLPPAVAKYPKMPQKEYVPTAYDQSTTKKHCGPHILCKAPPPLPPRSGIPLTLSIAMHYADNRSIISSPPRVGDNSSSIEDDYCLQIDGGRYLAIDSGGNYYLSDRPQPIKGEQIPSERLGARIFKIDRGGDYFDLVGFGILGRSDDATFVGGDKAMKWSHITRTVNLVLC
ncbi:uncharacterized protein LOC131009464 isoform X2 [Salvia miltiorrhiza]|uniref:uncharacterized protein LOC131009464 isoform X2 n=1 Tax=Salvia miltiorrhiza TaxID=226208 RepID=UPI0025ABDCDB|nr:uncharacterized protein LOC131009464 isoform X2 [Salvia miltiorrhiza]XP_057792788.1 uncharacterized protein LOC131009464 isoform X2 [Salvia miltiorrhiza]